MLNYIIWNVNPEIFNGFPIRWYGLFFAIGFFLSYWCALKVFTREGLKQEQVDSFAFGIFIFLLLGLRLGHCCFYEPDVYLKPFLHPILPDGSIDWNGLTRIFRVWEGGLASHGGGIGLICAFLLYAHKFKRNFWWLASRVVLVLPITAFFVRMGNLMNSEIYGVATNLPWAFVFVRDAVVPANADILTDAISQAGLISGDAINSLHSLLQGWFPTGSGHIYFNRLNEVLVQYNILNEQQTPALIDAFVNAHVLTTNHPTQIYEAVTYLFTGIILIGYYHICVVKKKPISDFIILGVALIMIFVSRFCFEFIKNDQVDFEQGMTLNMGQLLSIPFILGGIAFLIVAIVQKKKQQ